MRRPYRWSMWAYPQAYRDEHGDELIETALEMRDGQWSALESVSFLRQGLARSLKTPRRFWRLAVVLPVIWPVLLTWFAQDVDDVFHLAAWSLKLACLPCAPLLLWFLAERVAERNQRWKMASGVWVVVGIASIGTAALFHRQSERGADGAAYSRLWPGMDVRSRVGGDASLVETYGDDWTVVSMLTREALAVAVLALVAGLVIRMCARSKPAAAMVAVPISTVFVLWLYTLVAPWAMSIDFDFFVGDALLGATTLELLFFFAPFEPVGALGLAVANLTMGGLLGAWGGPLPATKKVRLFESV